MGKTILGNKKLTDNSAEDFAPAVSPDGTRIAFTSDRHGSYDVYVMNRNGTGQTRLTSSPASDAYPAFSADGERIVFQSDRDGENDQNGLLAPEIYVMDADGTGETRLTHDAGGAYDPSFSPNGSEIAFTSTRDGNAEIYVMGADGADAKDLTNNPAADVTPDWSPDGTRIAFTSDRDSTSAGHPNLEVFVMQANGAKQRNLTNNNAPGFRSADRDPAFSPDGQKITFNTYRDGNDEVYVMNSNGSNVENLSKFPSAGDVEPTWSPRQQ
jgi:TolB protein